MRIALAVLLVGCSDGVRENEALDPVLPGSVADPDCDPVTSPNACCVEVEGLAPCCHPPPLNEFGFRCPDEAEVVEYGDRDSGTFALACEIPQEPPNAPVLLDGPRYGVYRYRVVQYGGLTTAGDELTECWDQTGRLRSRIRVGTVDVAGREHELQSCWDAAWDEDGQPDPTYDPWGAVPCTSCTSDLRCPLSPDL